jgi:Outer membrane lipoprotein carrier protein LolA-like
MISGKNKFMRLNFLCALMAVFFMQIAPSFAADNNDALLTSVMNRLAAVKSAKADFTEKKFVKLLNAPVESTGVLTYTAPDRFEKHTKNPVEERMTVERDTVTLDNVAKKKKQQIFIPQFPALAAIVDAMRGALSGNLPQLQQAFSIKASGTNARWKLHLVPLEANQYAYIHAVDVAGRDDFIESIEILQSDGDRSAMSMTRAAP